mgnify:CR=1 FL=1
MEQSIINVKSFFSPQVGRKDVLETVVGIYLPIDVKSVADNQLNSINFYSTKAIWDTGATGSCISKRVVDALNLTPVGQREIHHATGSQNVNIYIISIALPNGFVLPFLPVSEVDLGDEYHVLIGMDVINQGDFAVSNYMNNTAFTFRMPSIEVINFNVPPKSPTTERSTKIGRNSPCSCGSGKKYKNCCGKNI